MNRKELLILLIVVIAMSSRFLFLIDGVSVMPNFTAVGAIAILGAVHFKGMRKWLIPLGILWISDLILNNVVYGQYFDHFQVFGEFWVYLSFIIVGFLAYSMMKKASWGRLIVTSLAAGVVFYLITNFGVWINAASPYSKDFSGLLQSYQAGLPFFRNTLLGNLFYGFVLFGAYEFIAIKFQVFKPVLGTDLST